MLSQSRHLGIPTTIWRFPLYFMDVSAPHIILGDLTANLSHLLIFIRKYLLSPIISRLACLLSCSSISFFYSTTYQMHLPFVCQIFPLSRFWIRIARILQTYNVKNFFITSNQIFDNIKLLFGEKLFVWATLLLMSLPLDPSFVILLSQSRWDRPLSSCFPF